LIQQGLIARTARGRIATAKTWQTMGLKPPKNKFNQDIFE
jgi:Holliday junction resolvasome RuvABC ATP-dependent DNA helicase subunit